MPAGCTRCCEQQGFVYLTEDDLTRLAAHLGMTDAEFERRYVYRTKNLRRLRVPKTCAMRVSGRRRLQCSCGQAHAVSKLPFWPELVDDRKAWHKTGSWCPGIGKGELVNIDVARSLAEESAWRTHTCIVLICPILICPIKTVRPRPIPTRCPLGSRTSGRSAR